MRMEGPPKTHTTEGGDTGKESIQMTPEKVLGILKEAAERALHSYEEMKEKTPKIFGWIPEIKRDMQKMQQDGAAPYLEQIKTLLRGTGEIGPKNDRKEIEDFLRKLDTPEFREQIKNNLPNTPTE